MKINNGDVFDIGQTINGVSRFLWLDGNWYYYEKPIKRLDEYNTLELIKIITDNEFDEVTFVKNILYF